MRKILLSFLLCTFAVATWAQTSQIRLTFNRTGTDANSVSVSVADQGGNEIEGVSASLTAASHTFKGTAGDVTSSILCPNVNGNTNPTIRMTFVVNGLGKFNVSSLDLYTHALNGQNGYQATDDNKARQWDMEVNQDDNVSILRNQDLAAGNVKKQFELPFENPFLINGSTTITLTITKGNTNEGCFFGLSEIVLNVEGSTYQVVGTQLSSNDLMQKTSPTYIAIKNVSEFNHAWFVGNKVAPSYSQDQFDENAIFVWEPVEEGKAGNYYLKKLDNTYMQTSAPKDYGEKNDAAQFTAVTPIHGSNGNTAFGDDSNILSYVIDGYEDLSLVRFVNNAGKWINVQRHNDDANRTDVTPLYNTGTGGYTYYYVYEVKEVTGYTANITDAKYSTMYTSYNVTLPDGLSAYMVDGLKEGDISRVNLVEIDREAVIPAFTPLILYAETKGSYVLPYTDSEATVNTSGNLLKGTLDKTLVMEDGYVLSNPLSTGVGLYLAEKNKNNEQAFVNNGGKAYLPASALPTSASVQGFKFGDFTSTAIEGVVTGNESAKVIYDLSGRRLNNITNAGVYIINGKKVMVK